jgi:hypothetical protein
VSVSCSNASRIIKSPSRWSRSDWQWRAQTSKRKSFQCVCYLGYLRNDIG